jgi:hypothetical protein
MTATNDMRYIWDYFRGKGLTDYGVAGLLGNLYGESGCKSNVLERLCIKRYAEIGITFTDESYTRAVDIKAISKDEFLKPMGKHYGYGLAQWTTEDRKAGLYACTKGRNVSISDIKAQCDYLCHELENGFKSVLNVLTTAKDINTASDYVLLHFEAPRNAEAQITTRRNYSNEIYKLMEGNMITADKVLNEAESWNGYCEKKNASNLGDNTPEGKIVNAGENNYTIFAKHLRESTGELKIYPQPAQWCDIFCDDILLRVCIRELGYEKGIEVCKAILGGWSAYTPDSATYYKKIGRWSTKPQRGAQIFFKNSTRIHHTGWVLCVKNGRVYTIEGNTNSGPYVVSNGGQVRCKDYSVNDSSIAGYGLPDYEKEVITYPCWIKSGDDFYYRLSEGVNAHGWLDIKCGDGNTYRFYFDSKGKMLTDWQLIDNKWYFFHNTKGSGLEGALYLTDANGVQGVGKF